MQFSIWRTISSIGYSFGLVLLVVGIYAYLYYETNVIGYIGLSFYTYRNTALPIMIVGIILIILGFFTERIYGNKRKSAEKKEPATSPDKATQLSFEI